MAGTQVRLVHGLAGALVLGAFACRSAPPDPPPTGPLALPDELSAETHYYGGTLLGGPLGLEAPVDDPLRLRISVHYLERLPETGLAPLATRTRLVTAPEADDPLLATTALMPGAVLALGDAARELRAALEAGTAGRTRTIEELVTALPANATAVLSMEAVEVFDDPDNFLGEFRSLGPTRRFLAVQVARDSNRGVEVALALEGLAPPRYVPVVDPDSDVNASERLRPGSPVPRHEMILPEETPEVGGGPYTLILPSPFDTGEGRAFAIVVEVDEPVPGEEVPGDVLERIAGDIRESARAAEARAAPHSTEDAPRRALELAYAALGPAPDPRATLLYLSGRTGSHLVGDLALVADAEALDSVRAWLLEYRPAEADEERLAWELERTAYHYLATRALEAELPASLDAALLRHAGEVGRYPSVIEDLLGASRDLATFERLLAEENLFFLDDASPASRVRAFDWLAGKGRAPAGYDPLDPADGRRAALAAASQPDDETVEDRP